VVEEKGIYSVEKFLVARRQMYWQVYLHKTVIGAEKMLLKALQRARAIYLPDDGILNTGGALDYFLSKDFIEINETTLELFCRLDDDDVLFALKKWSRHPDKILSMLCTKILNRDLYKCVLQSAPFTDAYFSEKRNKIMEKMSLSLADSEYFIFTGETTSTMYTPGNENIKILMKTGDIKDISEVDNPLIDQTISTPVKKFYICYVK
jgi:HD superfamily phosphohydrolase